LLELLRLLGVVRVTKASRVVRVTKATRVVRVTKATRVVRVIAIMASRGRIGKKLVRKPNTLCHFTLIRTPPTPKKKN
jgi:hypothetical protein